MTHKLAANFVATRNVTLHRWKNRHEDGMEAVQVLMILGLSAAMLAIIGGIVAIANARGGQANSDLTNL